MTQRKHRGRVHTVHNEASNLFTQDVHEPVLKETASCNDDRAIVPRFSS